MGNYCSNNSIGTSDQSAAKTNQDSTHNHVKQETNQVEDKKANGVMDPASTEEEAEEKAATKIQAQFRGHQVRKKIKDEKDSSSGSEKPANGKAGDGGVKPEEEEVDIDLNDPEVEQAALKIQKQFRGFKKKTVAPSSE